MEFLKNKTMIASEYIDGIDVFPFMIELKVFNNSLVEQIYNQSSFSFVDEKKRGENRVTIFKHNSFDIFVERYISLIGNTYKTYLKIINKTNIKISVTNISSSLITGICSNVIGKEKDKIKVSYIKNCWCAEGEYIEEKLSQIYIPTINGRNPSAIKSIFSNTTYTTNKYFPVVYILDETSSKCYGVEIVPLGNWDISLRVDRVPHSDYKTITVITSNGNNLSGDFCIDLNNGEEYTTCVSLFTEGESVENCIENFNNYKREMDRVKPIKKVCFNDYLNCNWAIEWEERTKKLMDKAKEIGCDIYCMDSGWYKDKDEKDWFGPLGDWKENDKLFGENGYKGIIDYANNIGLIYGMWFELEVVTKGSSLINKPDSWFITYKGKRVYESGRYYLNLANEEVRKYLVTKVKYFYNLGVRYIKNDYNGTYNKGDGENLGCSNVVDEANINITKLYEEIRKECDGIIIENCSSGSMRADHNVLSYSNLQSFSDNEIFYNYPAIVSGSLMYQLPEKLGIWTVSYPQVFEYFKDENFLTKEYIQNHKDCEETNFSMVTGFFGSMYLSGRIDLADSENISYLKEGVRKYKEYIDFICQANPHYFDGDISFYQERGIVKLGLKKDNKILVGVWKLLGGENEITLIGKNIKQVLGPTTLHSNIEGGIKITFTKDYQARLYEVELN